MYCNRMNWDLFACDSCRHIDLMCSCSMPVNILPGSALDELLLG